MTSLTTRMLVDPSAGAGDVTTLCLLGGPYLLRSGRRIAVPEGSKRVLVFVALHGGVVDRRHIAGLRSRPWQTNTSTSD